MILFLLSTALAEPLMVHLEEGEAAPFSGRLMNDEAVANIKYKRALEIAHKTAMDSDDHIELIKAERVRRLVEENKDNPEAIDRILADEFGILVMDPKEKP